MSKSVLFNKEAKDALQKGMNTVADAVGSTLGAAGKTVIMSYYHNAQPIVSKDGVTVANSISLEDEIENVGAKLIIGVASKSVKDSGDGTTTSTVLAQSIINSGLDAVEQGANPAEVKRGIDKAVDKVVEMLQSFADPIGDDNNKIKNIATISANNDAFIGGLIADAYAKIGNNGLLLIEDSGTIETKIETIEGVEIPKGYMSPHFANNKEKMQFVHEEVLFLIADYTISTMMDLAPILNKLGEAGKLNHAIVIIARDFEGEAFSSMVINNNKGITKVCLVKAPSSYRNETMDDIAKVTGATVIRDEQGLKMDMVEPIHLGRAEKVMISEYTTTIIGGLGDKDQLESHKKEVKIQLDGIKDEQLKEVWEKRLAQLSGSIGVIKVGAKTDVELKEKKDRVDDAVRAVKSAIEEGIVVGGGVALIRCMDSLSEIEAINDEKIGVEIIKNACMSPLKKMLENASENVSIINDVKKGERNYGYNVKTRTFENLFDSGVIDPVKVVRCALQNAASVGIAIIGSDCLIVEIKPKQ